MAEDVTASSMGQSIGLGYRTKDIGPQLMQFQAADLARRSQEREARRKEKKAEGDKLLERLIPYETKNLNKKVQDDAIDYLATSRTEISDLLKADDFAGATERYVQTANKMNEFEKESTSLDNILKKAEDPNQIIPEDLLKWASSTDPSKRKPTDDQIQQWNALGGIEYDPKTNVVDYKGVKVRDVYGESNAVKPTLETFKQFNVTPITSKQPKVAGQESAVSLIYVPNEDMWKAHKQQLLNDPDLVINGVNRIAKAQGLTYGQLAINAKNEMLAADPSLEGKITYEAVNKYMLDKDLEANHRKNWIDNHTVDDKMNPVTLRGSGSGSSSKDDEEPANPADVIGSEHLTKEFRKEASDRVPASKNLTDKQILDIANKPYDELNATEKAYRYLIDQYKKTTGEQISHTKYPTVQVQQTTDILTMPSSKKSVTQKVDTIYYDTDDDMYYATLSSTPSASGVNAQALEQQVPLTIDDLNALKSSAVNDKKVAKALKDLNANAAQFKYPTVNAWIMKESGKRSGSTSTSSAGSTGKLKKITQAQYDKGFNRTKKNIPGLTHDQYKERLAAAGYTL